MRLTEEEKQKRLERTKEIVETTDTFRKTTFGDVVLGAVVWFEGQLGQKVDKPNEAGANEHGQGYNFHVSPVKNPLPGDMVKTTYYSMKSKPELRRA